MQVDAESGPPVGAVLPGETQEVRTPQTGEGETSQLKGDMRALWQRLAQAEN